VTAYEIILKKRDGLSLETEEIEFMVSGFVSGSIPDYQMAAFLMAIYFRGLLPRELGLLTMAMVNSGEVMDLSFVPGRKVDKHSSGGVGDKTSLVVCPVVAACGVGVAKMSGRGLGHTGGTLDKLESIPGFRTGLEPLEFEAQVRRHGISIVGQTAHLAPADGLMYSLRDVTATVDSIPLIASSIMSKKIAGGADAIVLDVKVGSGAFMKTDSEAIELAKTMVAIGKQVGRETVALVTAMEQPLGSAVGNALEVKEAIDTLKGQGPPDFTELCAIVAAEMVSLGLDVGRKTARKACEDAISSGRALDKLRELVVGQGGDEAAVDAPDRVLPCSPVHAVVTSPKEGYVSRIDAYRIGVCAGSLGAGRKRKGDSIDPAAGIMVLRKAGDRVSVGEPLFEVHARSEASAGEVKGPLQGAVEVTPTPCFAGPIVRHRVTATSVASYR
jgi:pyrimidine-nucleoside phosphorylase